MDYEVRQNHIIVNCGNRLDIASVDTQLQLLKEVLASRKNIIFDASDIIAIDTASLQLLLSFTLTASQEKISWEWQKPSQPLLYMADLLGLRKLLSLPEKGEIS